MSTILIIGRNDDPHTEAVGQALVGMGRSVACFDTFRGDSIRLGISRDQSGAPKSFLNGLHQVEANNVGAVWLRQKPVVPSAWWSPLQHDAARFSQSEWRNVIQPLEHFVPASLWMNRPSAQVQINYKPAQLLLARKLGFSIPRTEITNDPSVVAELIDLFGKVIYKSLSGYVFSDQTAILTSVVTQEGIERDAASINRAPGIYQQFVEKQFEVRVTALRHRCFCARIETPLVGPASVDWRHAQFEDVFRSYDLPVEVEERIYSYLTTADLHYGAFDFIVTPDGEWYFLECNPVGQFLWLEHTLGHPIAQAVADSLAACHNG